MKKKGEGDKGGVGDVGIQKKKSAGSEDRSLLGRLCIETDRAEGKKRRSSKFLSLEGLSCNAIVGKRKTGLIQTQKSSSSDLENRRGILGRNGY